MAFTQLQVKTAFSLLHSPSTIKNLVNTAKSLGYDTLAITDDDVVYGWINFYEYCQSVGIKPILGMTGHFDSLLEPAEKRYPYLLYAQDNQGYTNLLSISSKIMLSDKRTVTFDKIQPLLNHIYMIIPPRSELEYLLEQTDTETVNQYYTQLTNLIGANQLAAGVTLQGNFTRQLTKLEAFTDSHELPLVALGKVDYVHADQAFDQQVMTAIDAGTKLNLSTALRATDGPFYLENPQEATQTFIDANLQDALVKNAAIAADCTVQLALHHRIQLPKFDTPAGQNATDYLRKLVQSGLHERLGKVIPENYQKRADYELNTIDKMGFSDYFLIVWDVMNYTRQVKIMTGAGRGSAAGSLVAYALAITEVDPLQYNLLFERFLNPNRANMPDIDLDIPDNRRDELLQYVYHRYGKGHVAQIITFGTMAAKMALRDVGRVFGISQVEANAWSKAIPNVLKITLKQAYETSPALQSLVAANTMNQRIFQTASQLEGLPRHYSTHAAGVVLSDQPLTDRVALQTGSENIPLTQFSKENVEEVGLLKMDFLGLKNLSILAQVVEDVRHKTDQNFDPKKIPLDDPQTLALFQQGDTNGVFQFESDGIKRVLRRLHPDSFEDIVATNALYRPGPMENIDTFIARKNGNEPVVYPDEALEPILKPTYGVLVYQEQVMQVASVMGGFTLGEADLLRRAMSKKKKNVIDESRKQFIDGAVKQGFAIDSARQVYEYIERFANYGFNRSHAVAYSKLAFWLAYLKCHFPASFFTALLNSVIGNHVKTRSYLQEAKQRQIKVLGPSINQSQTAFTVDTNGICFGFLSIKGMRRDFISAILEARKKGPFKNLNNFLQRLPSRFVKTDYIEPLIKVGAFDTFMPNRRQLLTNLPKLIDTITLAGDSMSLFEILTPEMAYVDDYSKIQKAELEADLLGTYISGHPLEKFIKIPHQPILNLAPDKEGQVLFYVRHIKVIRTKRGDQMAFLIGEDLTQRFDVTIFPNLFKHSQDKLEKEETLVISGRFEWDKDHSPQFIAQSIRPAQELLKQAVTKQLYLRLPAQLDTAKLRQQIFQILESQPGRTPVIIFATKNDSKILLKQNRWVDFNQKLAQDLKKLLGNTNVVFR